MIFLHYRICRTPVRAPARAAPCIPVLTHFLIYVVSECTQLDPSCTRGLPARGWRRGGIRGDGMCQGAEAEGVIAAEETGSVSGEDEAESRVGGGIGESA